MSTLIPSRLLKTTLLLDAIVSGAVAALQLAFGGALAALLDLPGPLLFESGLFLVAYVLLLLAMVRSERLWSWLVVAVIVGNLGWALGALGLVSLLPTPPNGLGIAFLALHALAVLGFAAFEFFGLRASQSAGVAMHGARS
jgi:hypothetical protein